MTRYLARRVSQSVAVLFIVSVIVFSILHFLPGSPARAMLGIRATPGAIAAFNAANGYNRALPVQYLLYIDRLLHGNLGFSYHFDQSVGSLLDLDLPKSALLVGASYVLALLIAIPMGIVQALRREKAAGPHADRVLVRGLRDADVLAGHPARRLVLGRRCTCSPPRVPRARRSAAALSNPGALILPVATLTIVTVAQFSRFMRASAVENLLQDYIRTARAKGLSSWRMVTRHLLRNSILPIITLVGLSLPSRAVRGDHRRGPVQLSRAWAGCSGPRPARMTTRC